MRVITGTAKGRKIESLEGESTRPTLERVKEALFSSIQFEVQSSVVLDLFAGTGQLGIEALSRGASFCVFIDSDRRCQDLVIQNLKSVNLYKHSKVVSMDSIQFLMHTKDKFDIVFLDPPYESNLYEKSLELLSDKLNPDGCIICECDISNNLPENISNLYLEKKNKYGKTNILIYRNK